MSHRRRPRVVVVALILVSFIVGAATPAAAARPPTLRTLEIVTVPPTPAARMVLDGQPVVLDGTGAARITMPRSRTPHGLELLTPHLDAADGSSADFVRWVGHGANDQGYGTVLPKLTVDHNKRVEVAFQSSRLVGFDFVDQAHNPVSAARVSAFTLRSDSGQLRTVRGGQPVRLTGVRPVVEAGSAVAKDVTYYLDSLMVDGANVVNVGEQRVSPSRAGSATFVVLFRSVHFQVRDRIFGYPMKADITVTYPDGAAHQLSTAGDGGVRMDNLARGTYAVHVSGPGYAQRQTISLSRSQYVDLPVLSYVDMLVVGAVLLTILVALVLVGRRQRKRRLAREAAR